MIVVLHGHCASVTGNGNGDSSLPPTIPLLNRCYLDRLAARYRRFGAREVVWVDCGPQREGCKRNGEGCACRPVEPSSLRDGFFRRFETVLIADYRLWPDSSTGHAIKRHRGSSSTLTTLAGDGGGRDDVELIDRDGASGGCTITRCYRGTEPKALASRPTTAILARPSSLSVVWGSLLEAVRSGDMARIDSLTSHAQMRIPVSPMAVDSPEQYLRLTGQLLAEATDLRTSTRTIGDRVWALPGAEVESGCDVRGPVLLGKDARVKRGSRIVGPTVLGSSVVVGAGSFVGESVLLDGVLLPERSRVWRSVVEAGAWLSAGQSLSFRRARRTGISSFPTVSLEDAFPTVIVPTQQHLRKCHRLLFSMAKRSLDIAGALVGLAATLPLYPLIALAIKWDSPGPMFFVHRRQTRGGREFGCLKFRTMVHNAEALKAEIENEVDGPQFHAEHDPRLTRVGRILRRTNLDEVPQFWNVLLGHMSLVGPRPSPDDENQYCPAWREARLSVRPGLTGLWQVRREDREGGDFHQWIQYDTEYVRGVSLRTDLAVIWETVLHMLGNIRFLRDRTVAKTRGLLR